MNQQEVLGTNPVTIPRQNNGGNPRLLEVDAHGEEDVLRAEMEGLQQPSRVGRLLDNTWVLVSLLA